MASAEGAPDRDSTRAQPAIASCGELVEMHCSCVELLRMMEIRSASGRSTQGRYKKHDSARLAFIHKHVLPNLRIGKLPNALERKLLFEYPGPGEIVGPAIKEMDDWSNVVNPRPGSKAAQPTLTMEDQETMLRWVSLEKRNVELASAGPGMAALGRPSTYKVHFGSQAAYQGKTIHDVVSSEVGGLRWVKWICGCGTGSNQFDWSSVLSRGDVKFEHLFATVFRMQGSILVGANNERWKLEIAPRSILAFQTAKVGSDSEIYERALAAAEAAALAPDAARAGDDEDDAVDQGMHPSSFDLRLDQNTVNQATVKFVEATDTSDYATWSNMLRQAPDPVVVTPFTKDAWDVLNMIFYDPVRFYAARLAIPSEHPCPRGGWGHKSRVGYFGTQWRRPRLVKGREGDVALMGRTLYCKECKEERNGVRKLLLAAQSQGGVPPDVLGRIKARLDNCSYKWNTCACVRPRFLLICFLK
jgi:hypothetical protein